MFVVAYYVAAVCGLIALPVLLGQQDRSRFKAWWPLLLISVLAIYFVGMIRVRGVDMANYRYAYEVDPTRLPDFGFRLLIIACRSVGLPFQVFMLGIGMVNAWAIRRLALRFNVGLLPLVIVWFLHLVIVRDFAQLRISFAASLALLAICADRGWVKYLMYIAASSMHYSSLVFIMAYEVSFFVASLPSARWRVFLVTGMVLGTIVIGRLLSLFAALDPRIDIYLKWNEPGYGNAVESYNSLFLHFVILGLAYVTRFEWRESRDIRALVYMQLLGITTFIAFSGVAIIAFRLSNVMLSLYPLLLLICVRAVPVNWQGRPARLAASAVISLLIAIMLVARPGSYGILERIAYQ